MAGQARRWDIEKVRTTCPFCGTGCNFDLAVKDKKIIGVLSDTDAPVNGRSLFVKGRFGWDYIYNEKRGKISIEKYEGTGGDIIIPALIPLALRGVRYRVSSVAALLKRNIFIYGLGGLLLPFVCIKIIDMIIGLIK